jgi:hypothetical protein
MMFKIGNQLLEKPKTLGDCRKIFKLFSFKDPEPPLDACIFPNARRLVEINNEVYAMSYGPKE